MVLYHIVGVGASLHLGRLSWTLGAGPAATDVGLARKRMILEIYASEPPARQAPMFHGIQVWLYSGRLSVRSRSTSFRGADLPRRKDGMIPWLPEAVQAVVFALLFWRQRLHARQPLFLDSSFLRYPFNKTLCRLPS